MRHLVYLAAGGLEEDRRPHPSMDIPQGSFGIRVERPGVGLHPRDVGVDGRNQARFSELPEHHAPELRHLQGR